MPFDPTNISTATSRWMPPSFWPTRWYNCGRGVAGRSSVRLPERWRWPIRGCEKHTISLIATLRIDSPWDGDLQVHRDVRGLEQAELGGPGSEPQLLHVEEVGGGVLARDGKVS